MSDAPRHSGRRCSSSPPQRSLGAHTYFVPVAHTRSPVKRLGPDALLAPELACVLDTDSARARTVARRYAATYLGMRNYTSNLRRFGFGDQDIDGGGSDRLIDAIIPHGPPVISPLWPTSIWTPGPNHVCLQPVGLSGMPTEEWTALAAALELGGRAADSAAAR